MQFLRFVCSGKTILQRQRSFAASSCLTGCMPTQGWACILCHEDVVKDGVVHLPLYMTMFLQKRQPLRDIRRGCRLALAYIRSSLSDAFAGFVSLQRE